MKYEFLNKKITKKDLISRSNKWSQMLKEFANSSAKTCVVSSSNLTDKKRASCGIRNYLKKNDLGVDVFAKGSKIYIVKE